MLHWGWVEQLQTDKWSASSIAIKMLDQIKEIPFPQELKQYDVSGYDTFKNNPEFKHLYMEKIQQHLDSRYDNNGTYYDNKVIYLENLERAVSSQNKLYHTPYGKFIYIEGCVQHACDEAGINIIYDLYTKKILAQHYHYSYDESDYDIGYHCDYLYGDSDSTEAMYALLTIMTAGFFDKFPLKTDEKQKVISYLKRTYFINSLYTLCVNNDTKRKL